jgi:hypothetical protein
MSFANQFDSMIKDFCHNLSIKYNIPEADCYDVWAASNKNSNSQPVEKTNISTSVASSVANTNEDSDLEITEQKVMAITTTKDMLAVMCKKKGLKQSGKKEDLVKRLLDALKADKENAVSSGGSIAATNASVSVVKKPAAATAAMAKAPVIVSIKERSAEMSLSIRKNKFGFYEHTQTGLVFNTDKLVHGKQHTDGSILDLTLEDIEICKKYKFQYKLPANLNTSNNVDNVKIDEIDDEILDEEEYLEEEDEEEDLAVDEDV